MRDVFLFFFQVAVATVLAVKILRDFIKDSELNEDTDKEETADDNCSVDSGINVG